MAFGNRSSRNLRHSFSGSRMSSCNSSAYSRCAARSTWVYFAANSTWGSEGVSTAVRERTPPWGLKGCALKVHRRCVFRQSTHPFSHPCASYLRLDCRLDRREVGCTQPKPAFTPSPHPYSQRCASPHPYSQPCASPHPFSHLPRECRLDRGEERLRSTAPVFIPSSHQHSSVRGVYERPMRVTSVFTPAPRMWPGQP